MGKFDFQDDDNDNLLNLKFEPTLTKSYRLVYRNRTNSISLRIREFNLYWVLKHREREGKGFFYEKTVFFF